MRVFLATLLSLTVFGTLTGCAPHRYTVVKPPSKPLTNYSVLEIPEFKTNLNDADSKELASRFASRLHLAVSRHRKDNPEGVVYDEVTLKTDKISDVLVMQGTIINFEEGSRAKRYFIGFGAGRAYCTIQVVFTDKETGEEIGLTNFGGELAMGLFGGDSDEAVDDVVNAFIDYMRQYMST